MRKSGGGLRRNSIGRAFFPAHPLPPDQAPFSQVIDVIRLLFRIQPQISESRDFASFSLHCLVRAHVIESKDIAATTEVQMFEFMKLTKQKGRQTLAGLFYFPISIIAGLGIILGHGIRREISFAARSAGARNGQFRGYACTEAADMSHASIC